MSKFELNLDTNRRLLTVVLRGFWDLPIYQDYDAQVKVQLGRLRLLPGPRACLVDARDFAVQPKAVADLMVDGIAKRIHLYPERTARVVSCAIARGQAGRMTDSPTHRVYEAIEPALDWLLDRRAAAA